MKIEIRYPKKDEMPELFALLKICFPIDRKIFELMEKEGSLFGYEPKVLLVDGKIVSNVSLVRRDIYIGSKTLKGIGVASVATHPDYRRKGYAKMLLKERLRDISLKGADFSPLFTDKPFVYEKLGWKIFPQKFWVLEDIEVPLNARKKKVEIFRNSTKTLMGEVERIYQENILFFPGSLKRDKEYWQEYFHIFDLKDNELFFLLQEENVAKAYARICQEKDDVLLGEMGVGKEDNEAIKGLFYYLLDWVRHSGFEKLVISLPSSHPIFEFLKMENIKLREENPDKREVLMIRNISSQGEVLRDKEIKSRFHWGYFDRF